MIEKMKHYIKNPKKLLYIIFVKYCNSLLSEEMYIKLMYRIRVNKKLNLQKPVTYNEKLQWLKLYWHNPLASSCADKYLVRDYVKKTIGSDYLNELIDVYYSTDEINLDLLPNKFVLKGTHGSGFNIIVDNKDKLDWDKESEKMKKWLKTDYSKTNKEWVYKNLEPKIIAEKYIASNTNDDLKDYRIFCFNGEPKFVSVDFSITNKKNTRRNLYSLDWELMNEEIHYPKEKHSSVERPKKLDEMINLAKKLSKPFPHVRVDFFYFDNKIIFGELTFFHQSGMANITPPEFDIKMENWISLPELKEEI